MKKTEENGRFDNDPVSASTTLVRGNRIGGLHYICRSTHDKSLSGSCQAASIQATTSSSISQSVAVECSWRSFVR